MKLSERDYGALRFCMVPRTVAEIAAEQGLSVYRTRERCYRLLRSGFVVERRVPGSRTLTYTITPRGFAVAEAYRIERVEKTQQTNGTTQVRRRAGGEQRRSCCDRNAILTNALGLAAIQRREDDCATC